MWDDIRIGGESTLCSAWTAYKVPDGPDISHNGESYWVSKCVLDTGMRIMKDTPEGQELAQLLIKPDDEALRLWFAALVFRHLEPAKLMFKLEYTVKEAFEAGRATKALEMRRILGL